MIPPQQSTTSPMKPRGAFVLLEGVDRCGKTTQCKSLVERLLSAGIAATLMRFPDRATSTGVIINDYLTQSTTNAVDDRAIHLLFSANRWESAATIVEHLRNGTTVVCDRYVYSGVAFSASKIKTPSLTSSLTNEKNNDETVEMKAAVTNDDTPDEPLLDIEWCKAPDRGLPAPDCVLFLDVSPDVAEQRGGYVYEYSFFYLRLCLNNSGWNVCLHLSKLYALSINFLHRYGGERYEKRDIQQRVRKQFNVLRDEERENVPWSMIDADQSIDDVSAKIWDVVNPIVQSSMYKPISKIWQEGYYEL
jgi:dTMP kinase